ncbi:hypothetical protein [Bacteriovorax sp. Seq25_V]|uniref:hypothetical protein n=1 Tax=Bacteriovorax sp. Seq25_V TaxID=1201288 RepID=UPI00038A3E91|nr:hypothetical protein [Bacteriovorax sp. Seq25_V]EQC47495.1 hypothetical protein M900_0624 [Bacteriovorax sp. Seq25_V]
MELIAIKTAVFLSDRGLKTLEDYVSLKISRMSSQEILDFKSDFKTLFLETSYKSFIEAAKKSSYWNRDRRLNNASATLAMLLMKREESDIFNASEVKFIYALQNLDFIENKVINDFNLSNIVVKLTGAVGNNETVNRISAQALLDTMEVAECLIDITESDDLYGDMLAYADKVENTGSGIKLNGEQILSRPLLKLERLKVPREIEVIDSRNSLSGHTKYTRNESSGLDAIFEYFKSYSSSEYAIISKSNKTIKIYEGDRLVSDDVLQSKLSLDDRRNIGGAGIYYLMGNKHLYNSDGTFFKTLEDYISLDDGSVVIILPSDERSHNFRVKNHELAFNSSNSKEFYTAYNYTGRDHHFIPIKFKVESRSQTNVEFAEALESEKRNLMKLYGMDSDTYNELAKFAYGVMNVETQYGESLKYKIKETAPILVSIAKGNGLNVKQNSRGLTQMKRIPKLIVESYRIKKSELDQPRAAAVATVGFAYELLQDLKRISHHHKDINSTNIYDYLYYLYQGKRGEITKGTATPDKNLTIRKIEASKRTIELSDVFN